MAPLALLAGAAAAAIAALMALVSALWSLVQQVISVLVRPILNALNAADPQVPLSPADAADMVERNILTEAEGADEAAQWGLNSDRFNKLVLDTGEPYGIDQALSLLRRGLISEDRFSQVLYYSRVRNEFLPDVLQLGHDTMTPGDAIEGVLKGVLDFGTGQALFEKGGGLGEQFQTLVDIAGNPIGVEHADTLLRHGIISEDEFKTIVLHSRINPMFYDVAKLTGLKWLSVIQIELALKAGTVPTEDATRWLLEDGYPADQVAAFVQGAAAAKVTTHKNLTESQVTELYDAGYFTKDQATAELQALGYEPGEVEFILDVYNQRRILSMAQAAINQVRKVYLAGRVGDADASAMLDSLSVDHVARDAYLAIWKVEKASELRELSMAQIGSAYKKGLLSDQDAEARWSSMGYSDADVPILLALYGGPPPPGSPAANAPASSSTPTTGTAA